MSISPSESKFFAIYSFEKTDGQPVYKSFILSISQPVTDFFKNKSIRQTVCYPIVNPPYVSDSDMLSVSLTDRQTVRVLALHSSTTSVS